MTGGSFFVDWGRRHLYKERERTKVPPLQVLIDGEERSRGDCLKRPSLMSWNSTIEATKTRSMRGLEGDLSGGPVHASHGPVLRRNCLNRCDCSTTRRTITWPIRARAPLERAKAHKNKLPRRKLRPLANFRSSEIAPDRLLPRCTCVGQRTSFHCCPYART